jgi:hypothetical protein
MSEVKRESHLIEVKPGVYSFADSEEAELRIRQELANLYRQNLELWRKIGHGNSSLWRETEALIRWLENAKE